MAGHPLLNQVRSKSEAIVVDNETYNIVLSYNRVIGIEGYIVGVKFSDASGSMDSSLIKYPSNPFGLARAVAYRVSQMLKPDLDDVAIMGFYLLTEELDARRPGGGKLKTRVYGNQALLIHGEVKHKLQYLTTFEVVGGVGWAMSVAPHTAYEPFDVLKNELAKQIRTTIC